ncbi:MAG: hypothetical protein ACE5GV_00435 [Candidatus Scalindua sp.]
MTEEKEIKEEKKSENTILTDAIHKYIIIHDEHKFGFEFMPQTTFGQIEKCLEFLLEKIREVIKNNKKKNDSLKKEEDKEEG